MPLDQKNQNKDQFKASLEDVAEVASKLADHCVTTAELVEVIHLALLNEGQLRIVAELVLGKTKK